MPVQILLDEADALALYRVADDRRQFLGVPGQVSQHVTQVVNVMTIYLGHGEAEDSPFLCKGFQVLHLEGGAL